MQEANIIDVSLDGRGVADQDGKKVFIPFTVTGERVRYERLKKKKKFDEAKLIEVINASPDRVEPRCEYFSVCGGCVAQHISAQAQIKFKQQAVLETLTRIGKVAPQRVYPPVVDRVWGYRRRARLAVKYVAKKERALVGFREKNAPYVTDMWSCEVLHPQIASLVTPLSHLISALSIRDKVPQVECSVAENAVALVFRVLESPSNKDIDQLEQFAQEYSLRVYLQTKGLDTVAPLRGIPFSEPLHFILQPSGIKIEFSPVDFVQVHSGVNQKMVRQAMQWLQLDSEDSVLDLFCGLGNFSLPIAKQVAKVVGVEGDAALVSRARDNAQLNQLSNVTFEQADLFSLEQDCAWLHSDWDVVILDPPRLGAREVIERLTEINPAKVLYVSCHPGTLARDADVLVNTLGYTLERISILNMFPHTGHVETMALFVRTP